MQMEMPTVTDSHKRLHRLAGSWLGQETMHPSPWDPKGGAATARVENRRPASHACSALPEGEVYRGVGFAPAATTDLLRLERVPA